MTPTETVQLLAVARAAFPGMTMLDGMAEVWSGALGDLRFEDCVAAIIEHAKTSDRIVTVANIRDLVIRAERREAGEERVKEIESWLSTGNAQERVPMPDWFRSTVEEHRRRARAARGPDWKPGDPTSFGEAILTTLDRMPKNPPVGDGW
jgi:hypothetical protein